MRGALRGFLSTMWFAALVPCGCGEAKHVLVESQPVLITPSAALPKNLSSLAEAVITSPEGDVIAAVDRISITLRSDGAGGTTATVSAAGVIRARVPAHILLFEVVLTPANASATWLADGALGLSAARYSTQLAAGVDGAWDWQAQATTDELIYDGVVVRTRLVYEALL